MKKVAVITVNYNGEKDTLEFLESLKKLETTGLEIKTIVVDNGSSDNGTQETLKAYPGIDLLQTGSNTGFTGGYNRGLEYAQAWDADYYFIINNDTLIDSPNLLSELIKTLDSDLQIGLVSPKIYFAPGFEFHKENYKKGDLGKVIWYGGGEFDWDNIISKHWGIDEVDSGQFSKLQQVNFVSGCCLLIKKEVLQKVGTFDETFYAYFEDNDLSQRITRAGFKKYYNGTVSIFHKVSQTSGIGSPITDYYVTRNRLIFGFRYARLRTKFALLRQAFGFLLTGRPAQRQGVIDFLLDNRGPSPQFQQDSPRPFYPVKLSLAIVNYNTADLTQKMLQSIYKKTSGIQDQLTEVVLLDNGHIDPCDKLVKNFPEVKYLQNEENTGFTKGYNRAMRYCRGEYILMLNSDMEVRDNCLSEITKAADNFEGKAVLGGRLYFPDGSSQDSVYHFPTIWGVIKEYFLNIKGAFFMYVPKPEAVTEVEGIVGACMLIPRKIIDRIGFLDENIVSYFEDHEYCRRLARNNIPVYFIPSAKFIHHHGASFKQLGTQSLEIHRKSSIYYYGKLYYILLYFTLLFVQKITGKRPPGSMEPSATKTTLFQKFNNLIRNLNPK
ncbi:MAG: glycosyltransferase family 2 protein [bacterium]|nr:glycosyltransferase family 2 protein [bacterium]